MAASTVQFFKLRNTCLLITLVLSCSVGSAHAWPWQWNRVDKDDLRHGRWRTYVDDEKKEALYYKGRYKHGKECGKWKSYSPDGQLYLKEKYNLKKRLVKTVYYHQNGKKSHEGLAYQYESKKGIWNYYWDGVWKYYDESGTYIGNRTFVQGKALSDSPVLPQKEKKRWLGLL